MDTSDIKHRRLYAFYRSKVLNALMIVAIISLLQIGYMQSIMMPVVCAAISLTLFIGYSLWLWIMKPKQIVINNWLSNINSWFTFYFLIIVALKSDNQWWYVFPVICAIGSLFICMIKSNDEVLDI